MKVTLATVSCAVLHTLSLSGFTYSLKNLFLTIYQLSVTINLWIYQVSFEYIFQLCIYLETNLRSTSLNICGATPHKSLASSKTAFEDTQLAFITIDSLGVHIIIFQVSIHVHDSA